MITFILLALSANYSDWLAEHSVPNLTESDQRLLQDEFPLQARWEQWAAEEAASGIF